MSDGVSTMFDPGKPCELAHNTSGIVVGVAMCFINPTAIKGTFGQVIANVVKIVQRLDAFADALNPLSRISNFVLKSAGTAMQATLKNGKLIIKVAMRADEVFREVDWSLAKTAQMIGPDGRTYTVLMSNDPMDAARTAGRKLKEILDDEKGIPLTDANGNGLAKVEVTDGEGNITEEVAIVKLGTEISEEATDLLTRLKNKLKNDYKWTDEEILAFEGDFKGDLDLLRKFDGDEGWVEAWKALGDFPNLRKIPGNLEILNKVKGRFTYNGKIGQEALEEIFTGHKSAQKFIDNLNKAEELFDGVGIKQWSGIKSAGEVRMVNDAGVVIGKVDNGKFTVTAAKGSRPAPNTYLTQKYIDDHLNKFTNEGTSSRVVLKKDYDKYGVGKPDPGKTEFVSTKSEIDEILKLPIAEQSKKLGIPVEQLQGGEVVRIDFRLSSKYKVEMPTGNEFGANNQWIPGGKLPEGNLEAIIKTEGMTVNVDYVVNVIQ